MTNQEIINVIEDLISLTECSEPAEDVVNSAVSAGNSVIIALRNSEQ